jgi:hypothetical protein
MATCTSASATVCSGGDPQNLAQNLESLLGKVLRLDVDLPDEECLTPYGIPADNPFAAGRCAPGAGPGRPEIFAVGVRNPWRMSFDRDTGLLWAGDVGQGEWEEVSVIRRGDNLGWRQVEGEVCYIAGCDPEAFVPPVWVYPHAEGKSITGGFVYRGRAFPELYGAYLYGDYDNGRIWALRVDERGRAENTLLVDTDDHITSFGEDPDGEIYVVTFSDGRAILALRRADAGPAPRPAARHPEPDRLFRRRARPCVRRRCRALRSQLAAVERRRRQAPRVRPPRRAGPRASPPTDTSTSPWARSCSRPSPSPAAPPSRRACSSASRAAGRA